MKKKLRILLYGDYFKDASGFAKEFRDILPTLLKKGHEVRQVALRYNGLTTGKDKIYCYPTRVQGVSGHFAPEVLQHAINDFKPDIVLSIHDYFALPHLVPAISKPTKKPFKFIQWGVADGEPLDRSSTSASRWVHHHIFHGKFGKKVMEKSMQIYFKDNRKIDGDVLYPPVNTKDFYPVNDEEREKLRKQYKLDGKYVVLFLSRNQYRKNTPALMEAVSKIKKVIPKIVLLMHSISTVTPDGKPEGYDLDAVAKYLDIEDRIATIKTKNNSPLNTEVINALYNVADAVCVPTMGEGFGLYLTEAMATNTPAIATDCSVVSEILSGDRGKLVKPVAYVYNGGVTKHAVVNSDDLANAIFKVYYDKKVQEKYIKNGQEFIKDLSPEKVTNKLLDILYKVIKEDKQPLAMEE